jgi:hypothetical protein
MGLSAAQLAALKADIAANVNTIPAGQPFAGVQVKLVPATEEGNGVIAFWYNLAATPDYWVWRTFVPDAEIYETTTGDGTAWSWSIYIARSQAERDAWRQMVNMKGGVNASLANVRAGVADIFSGAGGAAQRTHLLTVGRRLAGNAEKLFSAATAGGVGQRGGTANPDTMAFEGPLTLTDVLNARNS